MNLKIVRMVEPGVPKNERLHLSVLADANLNYYMVFATEYIGDDISSTPKHVYWFVDQPVKAGDHIILYTRHGTPSRSKRPDGHTNYFFFWDLAKTIWNDTDACAVLAVVSDWETSPRRA